MTFGSLISNDELAKDMDAVVAYFEASVFSPQ
jgi:hypothetical protein